MRLCLREPENSTIAPRRCQRRPHLRLNIRFIHCVHPTIKATFATACLNSILCLLTIRLDRAQNLCEEPVVLERTHASVS